ncbi:MAG: hypothetical protein M3322_02760 [Actinomycetota bacterium]|nr:hypothetical protein [Actinomycetota bacterium]
MRRRFVPSSQRERRSPLRAVGRVPALLALAGVAALLVTPSAASEPVSPPIIALNITGERGSNGWYRSDVTVSWTVSDPTGLRSSSGCGTTSLSETPSTTLTCSAVNNGTPPLSSSVSVTVKVDKTPPAVTGTPERRPDANGWYKRPVRVSFTGSDALSGIESCTAALYSGPDTATASVTGSCRDQAGNTGSRSLSFKYDATPPVLSAVSVASGDGVHVVRWRSSSRSDTAVIRRSPRGSRGATVVYRGRGTRFADRRIENGLEYRYAVQTHDAAGNASKRVSRLALPRVLTLRRLPYVPRVTARPLLRWRPAGGATYYHVQLFRGSKRLLVAWPLRRQFALPARWRYAGRAYRLRAGRYRWYVWAGFGRRSQSRYRRLGDARFVVVPGRAR